MGGIAPVPVKWKGKEKLPQDVEGIVRMIKELEFEEYRLQQEIEKEQRDNALFYVPLKPNPKQEIMLGAWLDPKWKVFTFTGGNRSSKTSTTCWILLSVLFGEYIWNKTKLKFPHKEPRKIRWVGQDWEKHIKTVLVPALWQWWPRKRGMPDVKKNNVGVEAFWTDPKTKSTLEIMSNKQESDLFEGWFGDVVAYDEPPKRDVRVACSRGLIDRQGREIFAMTLLKEAWVDREVINARNPDGTPDMTVFNVHAEIYDNVGFGITEEGVEQFAKSLKEHERDARLKGIPSYKHGIILYNFRRERNIRPRIKTVPLDWIIDVAIDFHPSKPWDVLFRAVDSRNFHYLIDEIHQHGSWKDVGEEIVRRLKKHGCRVNQIAIDPLAKGDAQSDLSGESVYDKLSDLLAAYGYMLIVASKDKENGIIGINDLLFTQNEMPALFVFDDLKVTIQQMEDWMYDENGKPSKEDDDMCENLYRLILLGTQYVPPSNKEDEPTSARRSSAHGRNPITGY
jgi:hypothetical protein